MEHMIKPPKDMRRLQGFKLEDWRALRREFRKVVMKSLGSGCVDGGRNCNFQSMSAISGSALQIATEADLTQQQQQQVQCTSPDDHHIRAFLPSGYAEPEGRDGVDYSGNELVRSMKGSSWEPFPYAIIVDGGASCSVVPSNWCGHAATLSTEAFRRGQHSIAANGGKIYNEGETVSYNDA